MRTIDLEEVARKIGWAEKHADHLILSQDTIAIIEETTRAKINDIEKLENTIKALTNGSLKNHIPTSHGKPKIIAIIHAKQRIDPMIPKIIRRYTRKNTTYYTANCNEKLNKILNKHGINPDP